MPLQPLNAARVSAFPESILLSLIPPYYLVALGLGLAAIVVVLFYSFTRTTNYEVQEKLKKAQLRKKQQQAKDL